MMKRQGSATTPAFSIPNKLRGYEIEPLSFNPLIFLAPRAGLPSHSFRTSPSMNSPKDSEQVQGRPFGGLFDKLRAGSTTLSLILQVS